MGGGIGGVVASEGWFPNSRESLPWAEHHLMQMEGRAQSPVKIYASYSPSAKQNKNS